MRFQLTDIFPLKYSYLAIWNPESLLEFGFNLDFVFCVWVQITHRKLLHTFHHTHPKSYTNVECNASSLVVLLEDVTTIDSVYSRGNVFNAKLMWVFVWHALCTVYSAINPLAEISTHTHIANECANNTSIHMRTTSARGKKPHDVHKVLMRACLALCTKSTRL